MALLGAGCTRCGEPYATPGIRVLALREEIAFVQLECLTCHSKTLALVSGAPDTEAGATTDVSEPAEEFDGDLLARDDDGAVESDGDSQPRGNHVPGRAGPPIGEADVVRMRAFLAEYQGDARGLFESRAPGRPSDGDGEDRTGTAG
jgi:hypothetical protein